MCIHAFTIRSEGFPERHCFSMVALLGWVVRDCGFLVVVVLVVVFVGRTGRDTSHVRSDETTGVASGWCGVGGGNGERGIGLGLGGWVA